MELCQARSSSEHFKNTEVFAMNSFAIALNLTRGTCHNVGLANANIKWLAAKSSAIPVLAVSRIWEFRASSFLPIQCMPVGLPATLIRA
jgi:hypothetical protein